MSDTAPRLETERLLMRPFAAGDLDDLVRMDADPEVDRYLLRGAPSRAKSKTRLDEHIAHWTTHGFGLWAVLSKASAEVIGECGLWKFPELDDVVLHYVLAKPYWGKGLATEAATAALAHGFEALGFERIATFALPANVASIRVMRKLGMAFERDGSFRGVDVVYYTLTRQAYLDGGGPTADVHPPPETP